ncbi:MAG: phosphatase PAP2 family protein [Chloroflexi bacterium]|nr:phosphatase PAP2 family protein [Chloroflexota bacterium]
MNAEVVILDSQFIIALGAALFLLGIAHMSPGLSLLDARLFRVIHIGLRRGNPSFRVLWHLGRTPFTLICIGIIMVYDLRSGVIAAIVFAAAASLEWSIKRTFRRPRPFTLIPDAVMAQPRQPKDASFPSGDAMRIWFLALTILWAFGLPSLVSLIACLIALIVTLGRIAMGVHFPLDTLAGSGLGLLAAGVADYLISSIPGVN